MIAWLLLACDPAPPPRSAPIGATPAPVLPPNVLIGLADDLGVDKVASYADHPDPPATPTIDALAARGVSFDRAYAYTSCSPSRGALLTGKLGHRTGLGEVIQPADFEELPVDTYTRPRMLAEAPIPWETAAYGKWHVASYASRTGLLHPLAVGFDDYAGSMGNLQEQWSEPGVPHDYDRWEKFADGALSISTTYATTDTVDDAVIAAQTLQPPWLLYVAFNAPHTPIHVPPEALATTPDAPSWADRYDAAVEAMDTELGRLLAAVDLDRTVVIFAGDNGTSEFGVRPPTDPKKVKLSPYEGGIRVPLVVAGPGVTAGARSSAKVHVVDVLPTVADLAGVDLAATGEVFDGESLWPYLADPSRPGRSVLHSDRFTPNGVGDRVNYEWWITHGDRYKVVRFNRGAWIATDPVADPTEAVLHQSFDTLPAADRGEVQALLDAQEAFFTAIDMPSW